MAEKRTQKQIPFKVNNVIINTWTTRSVPWVIHERENGDTSLDLDLVEKLIDAVMRLPVRVRVPPHFTELSLPRYYAIFFYYEGDIRIVDIIGVRSDNSPTRWGFKLGYWHPQIQIEIARVLRRVLKDSLKEKEKKENQSMV